MKRSNTAFIGWRGVILALAVIRAGFLLEPAQCQTSSVVLLLLQRPVQGGTITPDTGVHHFTPNTKIVLTAVPSPGFQFMCWLGDVSDLASSRTTVHLNAPKVVIAVFKRIKYEHLFVAEGIPVGGGGGGTTGGFFTGGVTGGVFTGGAAGPVWEGGGAEEQEGPRPHEEKPIPEPATILLLGLGSVMMRRRRY